MSEITEVIFKDENKRLKFEDIQPDLVFANEYKKLIFDIIQDVEVCEYIPYLIPHLIPGCGTPLVVSSQAGGIGFMQIESTFIIE